MNTEKQKPLEDWGEYLKEYNRLNRRSFWGRVESLIDFADAFAMTCISLLFGIAAIIAIAMIGYLLFIDLTA